MAIRAPAHPVGMVETRFDAVVWGCWLGAALCLAAAATASTPRLPTIALAIGLQVVGLVALVGQASAVLADLFGAAAE